MDKNDLFTLEDNIVNFIFDAIFTKNLQPGTKLSESVLAKELNTSRDVVRKAFSKLQTMGILSYKKNQGFHVVWISEENAKDIFTTRKIIEAGIVEIVTKRHLKENLDLSSLLENIDTEEYLKLSHRNGEYVKSSCDFHLNLAALSENEFLINALKPLIPLSILAALIYEDENTEFSSYDEHRVLIETIKSKNVSNAKNVMLEHLDHCLEVLDFDITNKKNKFLFAN
ncbi:GntR family transcriptional regulator [Arcobacter arenosus]|jgi:DNA-binding GntR family transcriptional regulator|uniref:GntR family transcriptional regulator n=1 Tax=Arcobacter arenosus TaxID=2576037 RepID=A0A5R8Y3H9_9BACT|nr:GntR family transcriptional regulator [Arcobacter arenosus]TLP39548.1 GntR family transcriptional regulator [Arcobacter arenosus]